MRLFVTGTDTNIGKTLVCSWLCAHTRWPYVKPIQTGAQQDVGQSSCQGGRDTACVAQLAGVQVFPETYLYPHPASPHVAAALAGSAIDPKAIVLPPCAHLIVEGAGGVMVPLTQDTLMIDLIQRLSLACLVVAPGRLGTINHTLLTLEALKRRAIPILGVILSDGSPSPHAEAITDHSGVEVLAHLPFCHPLTPQTLRAIPLPPRLGQKLELV